MRTQTRIQKLEKEVAALWRILDDERVWHPSVIYEVQKRSKAARQALAKKKLRTAEGVFAKL